MSFGRAPSPGAESNSSSLTPPPDEELSAGPSQRSVPASPMSALSDAPPTSPQSPAKAARPTRRTSIKLKVPDAEPAVEEANEPEPGDKAEAPKIRLKFNAAAEASSSAPPKPKRGKKKAAAAEDEGVAPETTKDAEPAEPAEPAELPKRKGRKPPPADNEAEDTPAPSQRSRRRVVGSDDEYEAEPEPVPVAAPAPAAPAKARKKAVGRGAPPKRVEKEEPVRAKSASAPSPEEDEPKPKPKVDSTPAATPSDSARKKLPPKRRADDTPKGSPLPAPKRVAAAGTPSGSGVRAAPSATSLLSATLSKFGSKSDLKGGKESPAPAEKRSVGGWTDDWVLTPEDELKLKSVATSRARAAAERKNATPNPLNLQEAKDAYRVDSANVPRAIRIEGASSFLTTDLPSRMVAAVLAAKARR